LATTSCRPGASAAPRVPRPAAGYWRHLHGVPGQQQRLQEGSALLVGLTQHTGAVEAQQVEHPILHGYRGQQGHAGYSYVKC
jgi:hypothetical protein